MLVQDASILPIVNDSPVIKMPKTIRNFKTAVMVATSLARKPNCVSDTEQNSRKQTWLKTHSGTPTTAKAIAATITSVAIPLIILPLSLTFLLINAALEHTVKPYSWRAKNLFLSVLSILNGNEIVRFSRQCIVNQMRNGTKKYREYRITS